MKEKILVIVPTFNCEKQIPRLLSKFDNTLQEHLDTLLIINNQSSDNTEAAAIEGLKKLDNIKSVVLRNDINYGYGGSLKIGFEFAIRHSFDWVLVLNGDDQSSIEDFLPLLNSREYEKSDVMWGCRFLKNSGLKNYSYFRIMANYIFNSLFRIALKKPVHDIGCGVYIYSTKILKNRFYAMIPDVLYIGSYLRFAHDFHQHNLVEFPIFWSSEDQHSSVKAVSQTLAHFKMAWQYLLNKKKFILQDHRRTKQNQYNSQVIFSSSSTIYDLNSQNCFVVNTEVA